MHRQCERACGVCTVPGTPHLERMPIIGWGTCCRVAATGEPLKASMRDFLRLGGRHIDTAIMYNNQREIGEVLREPEFNWLKREEVFITSKVPPSEFGAQETEAAVLRTLEELNTSYVDLMLLHAPRAREDNMLAWHALERALSEGRAKAIGVSNFNHQHLAELAEDGAQVTPMNNQLPLHPGKQQRETLRYCQERGISVTAYHSVRGRGSMPGWAQALEEAAATHGMSEAQVLLRWGVDHGLSVIPGCTSKEHLREALEVVRFGPLKAAELRALGETLVMRSAASDRWEL